MPVLVTLCGAVVKSITKTEMLPLHAKLLTYAVKLSECDRRGNRKELTLAQPRE